jgi:hypothetical protein
MRLGLEKEEGMVSTHEFNRHCCEALAALITLATGERAKSKVPQPLVHTADGRKIRVIGLRPSPTNLDLNVWLGQQPEEWFGLVVVPVDDAEPRFYVVPRDVIVKRFNALPAAGDGPTHYLRAARLDDVIGAFRGNFRLSEN